MNEKAERQRTALARSVTVVYRRQRGTRVLKLLLFALLGAVGGWLWSYFR